MSVKADQSGPSPKRGNGDTSKISESEQRKESSKAAQKCLALQKKAQELRKAAAGAGDPEERQNLLNQAIDAEIEAESFGKVAKYMRTGTFQGMAAGTGIGVMPGATLGALTGTLVGGTTSLITGSLGGAVGTAVGAVHGPFVNLGEKAGEAIRGVTGTIPGWNATPEQKKHLERMVGQANEQDMPTEEELNGMTEAGKPYYGKQQNERTWTQYAASYVPSIAGDKSGTNGQQSQPQPQTKQRSAEQEPSPATSDKTGLQSPADSGEPHPTTKAVAGQGVAHSHKAASAPTSKRAPSTSERNRSQSAQRTARKTPRKIEVRSSQPGNDSASVKSEARKPRKLEVRS